MQVIALVGKSGTGKSYQAYALMRKMNIPYLIDDGLLISASKRIAGYSAKKESTKLTAVKRAIFHFDDHREEMKTVLKREKPAKLLIIGTSKRMVAQIADNLGISPINEWVMIEDISSQEEIALARSIRMKEGKHVIPLPKTELKRDFSGYFLDRLKILLGRETQGEIAEKTIVRPTFSYLGRYTISKKALLQLIVFTLKGETAIDRVLRVNVQQKEGGLMVELDLSLNQMNQLLAYGKRLQKKIIDQVELTTGMNILSVNLFIKNINIL